MSALENARIPVRYLANLLAGGAEEPVMEAWRKLIALRLHMRSRTVGDVAEDEAQKAMSLAATTPKELEDIYELTALAGHEHRFVIPPFLRETAVESLDDPQRQQEGEGAGYRRPAKRRY